MASNQNRSRRTVFSRDTYRSIISGQRYRKTTAFIQRRPFTAFLISLGVLFLFILLGSILSNLGKKEAKPVQPIKTVSTYSIGKTPTVSLQAQVESSGVVQIVAQAPGIVSSIPVQEGDEVTQGQTLVNLSSNYQGGNAPALQAQLAGAQLKNTKESYPLQKDLISTQRNVATTSAENTEQLRQISQKSLNDTRDLLNNSRNALNTINSQIALLEQTDPTNTSLPTLRQQQAQLQSGVAQLQSTTNSFEYQTNPNNPPTLLSNYQKDITLKQLDVQEKALNLGKEVSAIQYNLALVQAGTMHPASPFNGTVERISVKVGQAVNPGQVIAVVSSNSINTTAVIHTPREIAQTVSRVEPSIFHFDDRTVAVTPTYVSTVATDNQLYTIVYTLPEDAGTSLTTSQYIPVSVPVGYADTNSVMPFVPIDAIYASQNESTVFVVENGVAVTRKIQLGNVYGDYVEVKSGLKNGDQIIVDRTVVAGDKVKVNNK